MEVLVERLGLEEKLLRCPSSWNLATSWVWLPFWW